VKGIQKNKSNDGRRFEDLFAGVNTQYNYKRVLKLEKVDPPTRIVGPGRIIFLASCFSDYVGTWSERQGRALFIEAKSTVGDMLPIRDDSNLKNKQIDDLIMWHGCGAAVGVVWESNFRVGFLPIGTIDAIRKSGRKYIDFREADPVPQGKGMILFDFAVNLRRWYPIVTP
jgi:hypothetical protein